MCVVRVCAKGVRSGCTGCTQQAVRWSGKNDNVFATPRTTIVLQHPVGRRLLTRNFTLEITLTELIMSENAAI